MDHLWAGWRSQYIEGTARPDDAERGCVFCSLFASSEPPDTTHIVWRSELAVAVLNAFPYTSGHVLVMPARHVSDLAGLTAGESVALWATVHDCVAAVTSAYRPGGINLGANLGKAAGAGIPGHLHVHVVPRWDGDTNFMTSIAATRVLPEPLDVSLQKLIASWPTS